MEREEGIQEVKGRRGVLQVDGEKLKTVGFHWIFTRGSQVVEGLQMIVPVQIHLQNHNNNKKAVTLYIKVKRMQAIKVAIPC